VSIASAPGTPRTKSLGRAVALLRAIATAPGGSSASELARRTALPRSTVTRTLQTLADFGLVGERPGGWVLGYELVALARGADPHRLLVDAARRPLERLRDASGESALLAVPLGPAAMEIVLQSDASHHIGVASWVGVDVPLHASAAGKVLLAELDDAQLSQWLAVTPRRRFTDRTITEPPALRRQLAAVRRRGWGEIADELEVGLASLAVPLRHDGRLAGIVGITGPTFRLTRTSRRGLLPTIEATAAEIAHALAR
jgi:DNA-binding IclR family transcriptional regulator